MRRRRRYRRLQAPDLWADLGPGDPGYRLRPGRSGFDPMETYAEYGRLLGSLLQGVFTGRMGRYPLAALVLLLAALAWFVPDVADTLLLAGRVPTRVSYTHVFVYFFAAILAWFLILLAVRRLTGRQ